MVCQIPQVSPRISFKDRKAGLEGGGGSRRWKVESSSWNKCYVSNRSIGRLLSVGNAAWAGTTNYIRQPKKLRTESHKIILAMLKRRSSSCQHYCNTYFLFHQQQLRGITIPASVGSTPNPVTSSEQAPTSNPQKYSPTAVLLCACLRPGKARRNTWVTTAINIFFLV